MIYIFSGDDTKKKLQNYEKFIKTLPVTTEKFLISKKEFNPDQIESFYSGSSLFYKTTAIIFSEILEKEDTRDFILSKISLLASSENKFVFLERKLSKPTLDAFKKIKGGEIEINIFELPKEKKEKFNNFLLANDLERKDKLNLWIHYRQAVDKGVGLEELTGVLFWKAKDMILKNNFRSLSKVQLESFISNISFILPQARKEGKDAELVFESFLLKAF
mgnify:CR=1 FL=1